MIYSISSLNHWSRPPPPVVVLIAWEKGEGVKCAGGRSISTESVQWCASFGTEEKFTAEQMLQWAFRRLKSFVTEFFIYKASKSHSAWLQL